MHQMPCTTHDEEEPRAKVIAKPRSCNQAQGALAFETNGDGSCCECDGDGIDNYIFSIDVYLHGLMIL